jgi:dTDP-4-dehydrorhamnose reductase
LRDSYAGVLKLERALVFGGTGQLGTQILRLWNGVECIAPSRAQVDVEDPAAVEGAIADAKADVVLNCTAFNDVPRAEKEPRLAFNLNVSAVDAIAQASAKCGSLFVTFSTDYVFDGRADRPYTEDDEPRPINEYGKSKLAGEQRVLDSKQRAYVVRTCGLYGTGVSSSKGYTFVQKILEQGSAGKPLRVVADQTMSPTFAGHLALMVRALIESEAPYGLYHGVNEGSATWYELATEALQQAGIRANVEAISSAEFASSVERPRYSVLENARLHALGLAMPSWQEGIAAYLAAKKSEG